ncbi:MAG: S-layer homology domain-containing protein [Clostridia bacterium]|nr:S-layer homology domain-containing protein [Clostridia bacterium]
MRIKKILSIILVLAMLSVSMPITSAVAAESDYDSVAVKLLQSLNLLSISENNDDFSLDGSTTRGQFALYVARLLMIDEVTGESEQYFTDVPKDHFAYSFINGLVDMNIISKSSDGKFNPDESITYEQAVKILVSALGYYPHAMVRGGYPTGYLIVAEDLDITYNVNMTAGMPLTKKDAVQLIYNSLNVGRAEVSSFSGDSVKYEVGEDTFLSMRDIYMYEGQLNAIYETGLTSASVGLDKNQVRVGSDIFDIGSTGARNYFGEYIRFYYEEVSESDNVILFIESSDSDVTELSADSIVKFSNSTYYYEAEDNKTKQLRLDAGFDIIYNNKVPAKFNDSYMVPSSGSVKIIDNGSTNVSSVVIISEYENHVVSVVDRVNEKIYTKSGKSVDLSKLEYNVYNANGSAISFDSIKEKNVLSVYESDDNSSVDIYVSVNEATGKIDSITQDSFYTYVTVSGTEYKLSSGVEIPSVGDAVTLYLDVNDTVAWIDKDTSSSNSYGYLLGVSEGQGLGAVLQVKVLTTTAKPEIFIISENAKINDKRIGSDSIKTMKDAATLLTNVEKKVIKYAVNTAGEINSLYIYDSNSDNYIRHLLEGKYKYNAKQQSFNGQLTLSDDAVVFMVPEGADDDDYKIGSKSSFGNDKFVVIDAYTFGDTPFADVVVRTSAGSSLERLLSVVQKISNVIDEKGEERIKLEMLHGGQTVSYLLKDAELLGNIENGDIIRIALSLNDDIEDVLHVYDRSENKYLLDTNPYVPEAANGYYSYNRIISANAYSMTEGLLRITTGDPTADEKSLTFENCLAPKFTVYIYDDDRDSNICRVGSYLDIISYKDSPDGYSKVLVSTSWGDPAEIVIIN